jgi:predicted transcriptional regulator
LRRLSLEEEGVLKLLPHNEKFMSRDIKIEGKGSVKVSFILCSLEERGLVKRVGVCGKSGRYILWKKILIKSIQ